ncbi:McrB family protein [Actinomadura roseirufa]|uniref:McrB family protein n=1 Tax=Actinomadura roseirufa TaxID=2094049 RepID=UPI001A95490F|nr:AAA family ATPase [Actinomadura roseirufa]
MSGEETPMHPVQKIRRDLLLHATLTILAEAGERLPHETVYEGVLERVGLSPFELSLDNSGLPRWRRATGFLAGDAATVGWLTKRDGWAITEAGLEALEAFTTPEELHAEERRLWKEVDARRKKALASLSEWERFIAAAVAELEAGSWTGQDDLAQLVDANGDEVAHFLAATKVVNSHRVLRPDGSVPPEGMLHFQYRGGDLRKRLTDEGLEFDGDGLADPGQRLTTETLEAQLESRTSETEDAPGTAHRAWTVRGSSVDGYNVVPEWLEQDFVSLSASQLRDVSATSTHEQVKAAVEAGYGHKSYAFREQRLEEFDRFLRRMHPGDLVLASAGGQVYLGQIAGPAAFVESEKNLTNLRRPVEWFNPKTPVDMDQLQAPVPALLASHSHVVELTEAYDQLAALVEPVSKKPDPTKRELAFNPITEALADKLLYEIDDLKKISELLWENKQIILYGPPGTGKTFTANKLAKHLTQTGGVKLVQFHPSYTYEDFFEGFRPKQGQGGSLSFELRPGPFRAFAEAAADDTSTPYILIIDEINRANLAKVFGELYFLLEYRDESISLQYSPEKEFTLSENLFIIGTMNTADRSIAKVDAAMRRRFSFIELHPAKKPIEGLLHRWLDRQQHPPDAALLLDELNRRIADADASVGPSYFMKPTIYTRPDGLDRVWEHSIMPLLEDLFFGVPDLEAQYGIASLRDALGLT